MENVKKDALSMKGQTIVGRSFVRLTSLVPEEYSENFAFGIPIETELKNKDCKFSPDIAFYRLCDNQDGKDILILEWHEILSKKQREQVITCSR